MSDLEVQTEKKEEPMSRHDWFFLWAAMSHLMRGDTLDKALWEAAKFADKTLDEQE